MLPPLSRRTLGAIGMICFANLLLEVVITRIFSTTMYYHFTFLAIALALLGMGAAGVYVYVRSERFPAEQALVDLARYGRRFAVAVLITLMYVLANPITWENDPNLVQGGIKFTSRLVFQVLLLNGVTALPFFYAGVVIALAVTHYRREINRVYAWDLGGAGLAALLAGVLLGIFGGPTLVLVIAFLALAAVYLLGGTSRGMLAALGTSAVLVALNLWSPWIKIPSIKGVNEERVVFEKWNTFSRVTVEKVRDAAWDVRIDASARTPVMSAKQVASRGWKSDVSAVAHAKFEGGPSSVLIIGPGGGIDVVNALAAGARRVTGVDVNPIIVNDVMKGRFAKESANLYGDPRVRVVVDDGRSFVRRSRELYDVLQATLVDTWAATAAGAFALSENTLYTLEAFGDYFDHLTQDGVLTMTRWFAGPEMRRLVLVAAGALERRGVPAGQTRKHLVLIRKNSLGTLIAKRNPYAEDELNRLEAAAKAAGFEVVLSPRTAGQSELERLVDDGAFGRLVAAQKEDMSPPSDDRPFFFYFVRGKDLWKLKNHFGGDVRIANPAVWVLLSLGVTLVALAVAFILLPMFMYRRQDLRAAGAGAAMRRNLILLYFGGIGLAFIVFEIALLQKLTLFLGHPSYALLVVLFSLLVASAVGARASERLREDQLGRAVLIVGVALTGLGLLYALALGPILHALVGWPLFPRILLAGALVMVCGFVMGVMLPAGVRLTSIQDGRLVPWGWGLNGATSVVGTVAGTVLAINAGFTATLACGALVYAVTGLVGAGLARATRQAPATELAHSPATAASR